MKHFIVKAETEKHLHGSVNTENFIPVAAERERERERETGRRERFLWSMRRTTAIWSHLTRSLAPMQLSTTTALQLGEHTRTQRNTHTVPLCSVRTRSMNLIKGAFSVSWILPYWDNWCDLSEMSRGRTHTSDSNLWTYVCSHVAIAALTKTKLSNQHRSSYCSLSGYCLLELGQELELSYLAIRY